MLKTKDFLLKKDLVTTGHKCDRLVFRRVILSFRQTDRDICEEHRRLQLGREMWCAFSTGCGKNVGNVRVSEKVRGGHESLGTN